jgi:pyruvate kinase
VVTAGMRVMRINFSHATYEEADLRVANLRQCIGVNRAGLGHNYNLRAIMLDTQGPEIRTGLLEGGVKSISLTQGDNM